MKSFFWILLLATLAGCNQIQEIPQPLETPIKVPAIKAPDRFSSAVDSVGGRPK